jgi:uncharacterized protein (TIGR03083 family)
MESEEYLVALAAAVEAAGAAVAAAGVSAPVPSCPGWTVADLLVHMTSGDRWACAIVEQRTTQRVANDLIEDHPSGDALVPWYLDGARRLVDALTELDPASPLWTFSPADRTARFWRRRRALETTVHRYDAQLAAGTPAPVDAALAADGIDEFLTVFLPRFAPDVVADGRTIHLHCTDIESDADGHTDGDADGEWLITGTADGTELTREHAKGDVAARGRASDLFLFLWGRVAPTTLDVFGDAALLDQFRDASHV